MTTTTTAECFVPDRPTRRPPASGEPTADIARLWPERRRRAKKYCDVVDDDVETKNLGGIPAIDWRGGKSGPAKSGFRQFLVSDPRREMPRK